MALAPQLYSALHWPANHALGDAADAADALVVGTGGFMDAYDILWCLWLVGVSGELVASRLIIYGDLTERLKKQWGTIYNSYLE